MTLCILPFRSYVSSYADDIQFFKPVFDAIEIQQRMPADRKLVSASKWFETNAMCLNVSKCRTVWLREDACNLLLYLDGKSIELCHSMKLLGVTIDSDLNFDEHVSELIRNVSKQLQVLKRYKHLISTIVLRNACMMSFFSPASPTGQLFGIIVANETVTNLSGSTRAACVLFLMNIIVPSLRNCRIHDMLTLVYKSFHHPAPSYINELLLVIERNYSFNLLG